MNAENFSEYLENPSHLYHITYQELKGLILQYPYCTHLHYLLAQKGMQDSHSKKEIWIGTAAVYSPNRSHLFSILQKANTPPLSTDHFVLNEDYLELPPLGLDENMQEDELPEKTEHHLSDSVQFSAANELEKAFEFDSKSEIEESEYDSAQSLPLDFEENTDTHKHPDEEPPNQEAMSLTEKGKAVFFIEDLIEEDLNEIIDAPKAEKQLPKTTPKEPHQTDISEKEVTPKSELPETPNPPTEEIEAESLLEISLEQEDSKTPLEEVAPSKEDLSKREKRTPRPSSQIEVPLDDLWELEESETEAETAAVDTEEKDEELLFAKDAETDMETHLFKEPNPKTEAPKSVQSKKTPSPSPKSHFSSWLQQFQSPQVMLKHAKPIPKPLSSEANKEESDQPTPHEKLEGFQNRKKKEKKKKKESPKRFAARSLEEPAGLVSEPLAKILAHQGSYQKAINMYEQLKLIFPEKSAYFAHQIDELKKEL